MTDLNLDTDAIREAARAVAVAYNTLGTAEVGMIDVRHSERLTIKTTPDAAYDSALRVLRRAVIAANPGWEYNPGAPDSVSAERRPFIKRLFDRQVSDLVNAEAAPLGLTYTCDAHPAYEAFASAVRRAH